MMDLIQTKTEFYSMEDECEKLSRKSGQSMAGELKQRMDVPLEEVLYPSDSAEKNPYRSWHHWEQ